MALVLIMITNKMTTENTQPQENTAVSKLPLPVIGIIAWLVPGAGHWFSGKKDRAIAIFCGIMFLFVIGIIVGGTALINPSQAKIWYFAQVFSGIPALIMTSKANMGYGRGIDIGQLYTACAGLLNLLCVIDAIIPTPPGVEAAKAAQKEVKV